jgi:hypothetical protein
VRTAAASLEGDACAVGLDGRVICWGISPWFYLDPGPRATDADAWFPTGVPTLDGIVQLSVGGSTLSDVIAAWVACALRADGRVLCFGTNHLGQLGIGSADDFERPGTWLVPGLDDVRQVAVGGEAVCAIRGDASTWCWGAGIPWAFPGDGALSPSPVEVPALCGARQVDLSVNGCVVKADGSLWCWRGAGNAFSSAPFAWMTGDPSAGPLRIPDLPPIKEVAVGLAHICALDDTGAVWCWGGGPAKGGLWSGSAAGYDGYSVGKPPKRIEGLP